MERARSGTPIALSSEEGGAHHMSNNEVISILNGLVETCERGERGFRSAAESVWNSEFRRLCNIFAQQRTQFISELQAEIHSLGACHGHIGRPDTSRAYVRLL